MSLFAPDPLLLSRTDRAEAWAWRQRWAYALVGWVLYPMRWLFTDEKEFKR